MDPPAQEQQHALYQQWREHQEREETEPSSTPLIALLCKFNGGCSEASLHRHIRKKLAENLAYLQQLAGITEAVTITAGNGQREFDEEQQLTRTKSTTIVTTHLKSAQFEIFPSKLTHRGADGTFALRGFLHVTIRQYYYVRHRINLRYPHLPLVIVLGGADRRHHYYYPLECLEVLEWEKKEN